MKEGSYKSRVLPYLKDEFVTIESIAEATGLPESVVKTAIRNLQHHNNVPVRMITITKKTYGCRLISE